MKQIYKLSPIALAIIGAMSMNATMAADDEDEDYGFVLEEINVTANKFSQKKVTLSGQADEVSAKVLENNEVNTVSDVQKVTSSIVATQGFSSTYTSYTVRGLNSGNIYEPGVAVYVDGVPQPFSEYNQNIGSASNVEVLKGPQGTVYGMGPEMGLISVTTKNPVTDGNFLELSTDYSKLAWKNSILGGAALYEDIIYGKIGVNTTKNFGWLEDKNGVTFNKGESYNVNGSLYFSGGEKVPLLVTVGGAFSKEYGHMSNIFLTFDEFKAQRLNGNGFVKSESFVKDFLAGQMSGGDSAQYEYFKSVLASDNSIKGVDPKEKRESKSAYVKFDYFANERDSYNVTFTYSNSEACDLYMPGQEKCEDNNVDNDQITAEARYVHDYGNGGKAILGTNFTKRKLDNKVQAGFDLSAYNFGYAPVSSVNVATEDKIFSLYGDLFYIFDNGFDVDFGLRYQHVKSKANGNFLDMATYGMSSFDHATKDDDTLNYKVALGYSFDDMNRAYVLTSSGSKVGGFSRFPTVSTYDLEGYNPETTYNYEIGYHLAHNSGLDANLALFYMDVHDKQAYTTMDNSLVTPMRNVGRMKSKGVELDLGWRSEYVNSVISTTYSDAENKKKGYSSRPAGSPHFTIAGFIDGTLYKSANFEAHLGGNGRYISKTYFVEGDNLNSQQSQGGYSTFDVYAKAIIMNNLDIKVYAENVTDKKYVIYTDAQTYAPAQVYRTGTPLNVGVSVGYKF